jgi:N-acetylneuraminate synthase/N,N'-diacetyllegionaminate synthase
MKRRLIAEIGGNHEGDFSVAKELLYSALETDCDVVKFQIYTGDTLVNPKLSPERNKHFKKFELTVDQYHELAKITEAHGKEFNASIWDITLFRQFEQYLKFIKIGSGDMTNYPLLEELSSTSLPILLSTGLANSEDVENVLSFLRGLNEVYKVKENLCLLQCTSMYPIPNSEANLNVLSVYKAFGVDIGYSDHTIGSEALSVAYAMGARTLEFHFTLKQLKKSKFRDHLVSLTSKDVENLVSNLNRIDELQGISAKSPTESEVGSGHVISFRRGVFLKTPKKKGEIVNKSDLIFLRPEIGISTKDYALLLGKRCNRDLESLEPLQLEYFI